MKITLRLMMMAVGALVSRSLAQTPGYFHSWEWQVQLPGETTWRTGLVEVPVSVPSVRVRAFQTCISPIPGDTLYWSGALLDATITGANGAGSADWVDQIAPGFLQSGPDPVATRFEQVILVGARGDTQPPGVGNDWWWAREITPGANGYPIVPRWILSYTLHLDATPGDREIGHIFGYLPPATTPETPVYLLRSIPVSPFFEPVRPSVTVSNAVIRVVPTPGTTAILTVILLAPRRRR